MVPVMSGSVPEGIGRYRKVLEGSRRSGNFQKVLETSGRF